MDNKEIIQALQTASLISKSLSYLSGRNYLEFKENYCHHFFKHSFISPQPRPYFIKINQLGIPLQNEQYEASLALQTILAACHNQINHQLVFLVINDGRYNNFYIGVRDTVGTNLGYTPQFIDSFQKFFRGSYPGCQLASVFPDTIAYEKNIFEQLKKMKHGISLTGVPSTKQSQETDYISCLARCLAGLQGVPFAYIVIANPINSNEINSVVHRCRDLIGEVQALGNHYNITKIFSKQKTFQEDISYSKNKQETISESDTSTDTIALGFEPCNFVSSISAQISTQNSLSINRSDTLTENFVASIFQSNSNTESMQIVTEFINAHVQASEETLKQYIDRFYSTRSLKHWNVGVYFFSVLPNILDLAGQQLQATLNGSKSTVEPIRWHKLEQFMCHTEFAESIHRLEMPQFTPKTNSKIEHPFGKLFNDLTTPLTTSELSLLMSYPRKEMPGIKLIPTAEFSLNTNNSDENNIILGNLIDCGTETNLPYKIDINSLTKHTLIAGITGGGKTTTCHRLLKKIHDEYKIPFLIIEPAKEEYIEWAIEINKNLPEEQKINIYVMNPNESKYKDVKQLIINPFDFIWTDDQQPRIIAHIDRFKSILKAALPMESVLPILLENALFETYDKWTHTTLPKRTEDRPTFSSLYKRIADTVGKKGYSQQLSIDLIVALQTRINSFLLGWKKEVFDQSNPNLTTPWEQIFDRPTIINVSDLSDDKDRAFTMAVILMFLYEYRQVQGKSRILRHLTVIEEAHRILLKGASNSLEYANPQRNISEMFANIISEIRAYGEGLLIVDQVPNRLMSDAIKNTNLKIVHRLVAADDREAMSTAMGLTPEQSAIINRLRAGQAIVYGDQDDMAAWIKVPEPLTEGDIV